MSLEPETPSSARFWNALLDGKTSFAVDQRLVAEMEPSTRGCEDWRRRRAGSWPPPSTSSPTRASPSSSTWEPVCPSRPTPTSSPRSGTRARVVYVDNDPIVLTHARALLTSASREGRTDYLDADFHDREGVLREAARTLDLDRPVGLLWLSTLGHVPGPGPRPGERLPRRAPGRELPRAVRHPRPGRHHPPRERAVRRQRDRALRRPQPCRLRPHHRGPRRRLAAPAPSRPRRRTHPAVRPDHPHLSRAGRGAARRRVPGRVRRAARSRT
ncbi:SAM-dependent methyltransferase [Streptomyces sp. M19]